MGVQGKIERFGQISKLFAINLLMPEHAPGLAQHKIVQHGQKGEIEGILIEHTDAEFHRMGGIAVIHRLAFN